MAVVDLVKKLVREFDEIYAMCTKGSINLVNKEILERIKAKYLHYVLGDLEWFTLEDPAANNNLAYANESNAFLCVKIYRFGKVFQDNFKKNKIDQNLEKKFLTEVMELGYKLTHISIDLFADIKNYFIIDHGHNSRINAGVKVGENFHIMQDIEVSNKNGNSNESPKIGNNVEIWSSSKIVGDIKIGDNSVIGTKCLVYKTLEDKSKVSLKVNNVITNDKNFNNNCFYGFAAKNGEITLYGTNLNKISIKIVRLEIEQKIKIKYEDFADVTITSIDKNEVKLKIDENMDLEKCYLKVLKDNNYYIFESISIKSLIGENEE